MAVFELLLFVLFGLGFATMFSGYQSAMRMGFLLMMQVGMLMFGMLMGLAALVVGLIAPTFSLGFMDLLQLLVLLNFIFVLLGLLLLFVQVVPVLMKTMQGGPIHNSYITNVILTLFLSLAMFLYYPELILL